MTTAPDPEYVKQYVEAQKVVFDYVKHITTLDTGSIVLLTVLIEKFFKTPKWQFLVPVIFLGFILSIVMLAFTAFGLIRSIRTPQHITIGLVRFTTWTFITGIIGFITAMVSLAVLAVKNWL